MTQPLRARHTHRLAWDADDPTYPRARVVVHRDLAHPYKLAVMVEGSSMLCAAEARSLALALLAAAMEVERAE